MKLASTSSVFVEIEHCTTKVRRSQSDGFIERFHLTLLDEHLRIQGCKMQKDLEAYLLRYNTVRPTWASP